MDNIFDDNFYSKRKHIAWRAQPVCKQIIKQFNPKSVIDVGCGIGEFLDYFQKSGIRVVGIENSEYVYNHLMVPKKLVKMYDITKDHLTLKKKSDIALCFMVIGRIPKEHWKEAANFLAGLSDTIITVVEEQADWEGCMREVGFVLDTEATDMFRSSLSELFSKTAVRSFQYTQIFICKKEEE
jgi:SAM-dependent methyltransferase